MSEERDFNLVCSFWIDTEAYSDRDREMFVCGVEFQMVYEAIRNSTGWNQCIHNENVSRVRMMCGRFGVKHRLRRECDTWTTLTINGEANE